MRGMQTATGVALPGMRMRLAGGLMSIRCLNLCAGVYEHDGRFRVPGVSRSRARNAIVDVAARWRIQNAKARQSSLPLSLERSGLSSVVVLPW